MAWQMKTVRQSRAMDPKQRRSTNYHLYLLLQRQRVQLQCYSLRHLSHHTRKQKCKVGNPAWAGASFDDYELASALLHWHCCVYPLSVAVEMASVKLDWDPKKKTPTETS
jgi:hypothetical protein